MEFLNPGMLYGLFALAVPVIVHLFNFRKHKTVYYSDVSLLENLKQQTSRTSKLRQLIILALRMLAMAAIVIAFAQPVFTTEEKMEQLNQEISMIYLDNSQSMQLAGLRGSLLDDARNTAISLVDNASPDKNYLLITNNFDPAHERPLTQDEMIEQLQFVETSSVALPFNDILERASLLAKDLKQNKVKLFVLSDFQESAFDEEDYLLNEQLSLVFVPFEAVKQNNVFIDSVWLTNPVVQPGIPVELNVKLSNQSEDELRSLALRAETADKVLAIANVDIESREEKVIALSFVPATAGFLNVKISVTDFPVVFDDDYFISLSISPKIEVLEIFEEKAHAVLELLFAGDSLFAFTKENILRLDPQTFSRYKLIIAPLSNKMSEGLRASLSDWVKAGGALLLYPDLNSPVLQNSISADLNLLISIETDTSTTRLDKIVSEHPFFDEMFSRIPENADLPDVFKHHGILPSMVSDVLIELLNGNPFLTFTNYGQGSVFHLAVPFDPAASGFTESALFPPLLIRMAFYGQNQTKLSYTLGTDRSFLVKTNIFGDNILHIKSLSDDFSLIPGLARRQQQVLLSLEEPLPQPGFYGVYLQDSLIAITAWNESRKESLMSFANTEDLKELFENKGYEVVNIASDTDTNLIAQQAGVEDNNAWWWFVLLAIVFLLSEALIIRIWKSEKKIVANNNNNS